MAPLAPPVPAPLRDIHIVNYLHASIDIINLFNFDLKIWLNFRLNCHLWFNFFVFNFHFNLWSFVGNLKIFILDFSFERGIHTANYLHASIDIINGFTFNLKKVSFNFRLTL